MEWHKRTGIVHHPVLQGYRSPGETELECYHRLLGDITHLGVAHGVGAMLSAEEEWVRDRKPYYKVWPQIAEGLLRVRLDVPCQAITPLLKKMPEVVSIRFPKMREPRFGKEIVREALVTYIPKAMTLDDAVADAIGIFYNDDDPELTTAATVLVFSEDTIEESIEAAHERSRKVKDDASYAMISCIRYVIGIAMLHDNPDMVEAVVLRKDQAKYAATRDPKYVEKAKRRGEYGFNVGANIEVLPHFRRPHFGIRWTGKGHEVPKLVPVKGCVVKRSKFTEVPTGYQADEEAEAAVAIV